MRNKFILGVRFPGFAGDWEQRKLGELCDEFQSGKNIKSEDVRAEGKYPVFGGNGLRGYTNTYNHDGLYALIGRQGALCGNVNISVGKAYFSEHAIAVKGNKDNETRFLYFLLDKMNLGQYSGQSAQPGLAVNKLIELSAFIPTFAEQTKIGGFFKQLDDIITLLQQELTILKQTKQGFLQKMFPKKGESVPDVRFPGFIEDWEQCKLDSMVDRLKSYSLSRDVETNDYTGYKYIHYGDIHKKVADIIDESSDLPNIKVGNYEFLEKGDLVLADASEDYQGIATPAVITIDMPYKLVSGLHTIALRPKQVDSLFLYYLISSPIFREYGYRVGTGMKVFGISVTNLLKFEGTFPSLEEQTKIGSFFKQLDNTIALHQRELDTLKETKKAFLQKMFV
ncbi:MULTISPECIES: restriction endonuclease subunit S [Bacillus]|uniref:Restriction endonuclease subunit S n=1 Tax=Bacillus cereus TaxID=1396 RepID=A0ABD7DD02_BACCE|nr:MULTISPECIES: restriction endonuclease subunit S [Bacillus cereus group]QRY13365.1 restriction endonuclease subunit S [Bacillus cereus]HDR3894788.1 restriction endonuclease subunit S [Bacillus cereus]HDR3897318.1 restriction endonuclease subunit S [Bacillus cereus]